VVADLDQAVPARRLQVSHAFHSPLMAGAAEALAAHLTGVSFADPQVPLYSTSSGRLLAPGELDAAYWGEQIRRPVRFDAALMAALRTPGAGDLALLDCGPSRGLLPLLVRAVRAAETPVAVPSGVLGVGNGTDAAPAQLHRALARLWAAGGPVDLHALVDPADRRLERIPGHTFSTSARFWTTAVTGARPGAVGDAGLVSDRKVGMPAPGASVETAPDWGDDEFGPALRDMLCGLSGYSAEEFGPQSSIAEDLGLDSVSALRLKDLVEQRWPHLAPLPLDRMAEQMTSPAALVGAIRALDLANRQEQQA
jgi:acyl transferase domain-containing protein